jgi:hypothetical protein
MSGIGIPMKQLPIVRPRISIHRSIQNYFAAQVAVIHVSRNIFFGTPHFFLAGGVSIFSRGKPWTFCNKKIAMGGSQFV